MAARNKTFWTKKEVVEVLVEFYEKIGRFPSNDEIALEGSIFRDMFGGKTPCFRTIVKNLGGNRASWTREIEKITGTGLVAKPMVKKEEKKEEVDDMGKVQYTFDEAVDKVLELREKVGTMPTKKDYETYKWFVNVEDLADALGVRQSMRRLNVRAYAAVNIAVLRELRRRNGEVVRIAEANEDTLWECTTSNLFERKDDV